MSVPITDRPPTFDRTDEPRLRLVPEPRPRRTRGPFVVLMLGLLGIGLVGLLLLNTSLERGAFIVHDLEGRAGQLDARQSVLEQQVATVQAPDRLAEEARRLGMVPNPDPTYLRSEDGRTTRSDRSGADDAAGLAVADPDARGSGDGAAFGDEARERR